MTTKGRLFSSAHKRSLSFAWARTKEPRRAALKRGWKKRRLVHGPAVPIMSSLQVSRCALLAGEKLGITAPPPPVCRSWRGEP